MMMEQLGKDPIEEEIPPDWEDFPEIAQDAILIFNALGNRIFPEVGYTGKDYTNLTLLMEHYKIQNKEFLLDLLIWLDSKTIKNNDEKLKAEYDKMKRNSSK